MTNLYFKSLSTVTVSSGFLSNLKSRRVVNTVLMPNGADTSIFRPLSKSETRKNLNLAENDFVIVYIGIIGLYYKLDIVLKTLASIFNNKNFKLLVVGDGEDLSNLKKLSVRLGLTSNVLFLGIKNNLRDVAEIISASDVGIIPGIYIKGQIAVKFFEYCACGVPVIAIAPNDSDIAVLINEYKVGLSLPSMDETKLEKILYELYIDSSFRVEAGKRARALIEAKFDRNKTAEQYLDLIEGMI